MSRMKSCLYFIEYKNGDEDTMNLLIENKIGIDIIIIIIIIIIITETESNFETNYLYY